MNDINKINTNKVKKYKMLIIFVISIIGQIISSLLMDIKVTCDDGTRVVVVEILIYIIIGLILSLIIYNVFKMFHLENEIMKKIQKGDK